MKLFALSVYVNLRKVMTYAKLLVGTYIIHHAFKAGVMQTLIVQYAGKVFKNSSSWLWWSRILGHKIISEILCSESHLNSQI